MDITVKINSILNLTPEADAYRQQLEDEKMTQELEKCDTEDLFSRLVDIVKRIKKEDLAPEILERYESISEMLNIISEAVDK